jgi:hypothetical protein
MNLPKGVFQAQKKDGTIYYRVSVTYHGKHISLGSFDDSEHAGQCYLNARALLDSDLGIDDYSQNSCMDFAKWVTLVNFRDNDIYFKTPIYLYKKYFLYYLSQEHPLKFDVDDLFYYSTHTIMTRNGYLFVADYGMQVNILSRYGIRNYAVCGRDYVFVNGDPHDFTYKNIKIINHYFGVEQITRKGRIAYRTKIHVNGDFIVGCYETEEMAAIAYNKAANLLKAQGISKNFPENYLENLSAIEYAKLYNAVRISRKLRSF